MEKNVNSTIACSVSGRVLGQLCMRKQMIALPPCPVFPGEGVRASSALQQAQWDNLHFLNVYVPLSAIGNDACFSIL